jgi:hypothetical protein
MGHGTFSGEPEAIWLTEDGTEDRTMQILKTFSFRDPDSKEWVAAAGSVVDGASIPRALWTIVGSPYTGDYRRASIVHDVACIEAGADKKKRRAADRMFFHACRAGGCSIWQSIVLYVGVRIGAAAPEVSTWHAALSTETAGPRIRRANDELQLERDFQAVADRVLAPGETDDPTELEERTDQALYSVVGFRSVKKVKRRGLNR